MGDQDFRQTWSQIAEHFHKLARQNVRTDQRAFNAAMRAMEKLARRIDVRPPTPLYGWTSMHALCIHQVHAAPYSQPFLRLEPPRLGSQLMELLLLNPRNDDDDGPSVGWSVAPDELDSWLDAVLLQVGWI